MASKTVRIADGQTFEAIPVRGQTAASNARTGWSRKARAASIALVGAMEVLRDPGLDTVETKVSVPRDAFVAMLTEADALALLDLYPADGSRPKVQITDAHRDAAIAFKAWLHAQTEINLGSDDMETEVALLAVS